MPREPATTPGHRWLAYLAEAAGLGIFMVSACLFTVIIEHPGSRLSALSPLLRRALMGLTMGATAIGIFSSGLARRSGAHINPAVTLAFLRLGRIGARDAAWYALAQFAGGLLGVLLSQALLGPALAHPAVRFAVTVPGPAGVVVAFAAEAAISSGMLAAVLACGSQPRTAPRTGLVAGTLVALYITFEAPLSGMSLNPARTLASALPARVFTAGWLYFVAPVAGMLVAAEAFRAWERAQARTTDSPLLALDL